MADELRAKTAQELLIMKGTPEFAEIMTMLCEVPEVKGAIDAAIGAGGSSELVEGFKSGVLLGFYVGYTFVHGAGMPTNISVAAIPQQKET
jgi:hypothetical protein